MFDETYVFMIFPTYIFRRVLGQTETYMIYFSRRKTLDPRRGFTLTVATRGVNTYVD